MGSLDPLSLTWALTRMTGRLIGAGARLAGSAVTAGRTGAAHGRVNGEVRQSLRTMAAGVLGPGDPPPVAGGGSFLDYRGAADAREVGPLRSPGGSAPFRLGRLVDIRRGAVTDELAVPFPVLRRHACVIGPPGSGKTAGLLVPWIYSALAGGHSVIAVDVKGDLLDDVATYSRSTGRAPLGVPIGAWDLTRPGRSITWDWLAELIDAGSLDAAVTAVLGRENLNSSADPYFHRRDAMVLRGLLRAAPALAGPGPDPAALIAALSDRTRVMDAIARRPGAPGSAELGAALGGVDPYDYPKSISGVTTALGRLDHPGFAAVTRPGPFRLDEVLAERRLLVVSAPLQQGETSRTASALLLNLLVQRLYGRFGAAGRHVFLVIDEAPRIVDKFAFEQVLSVARSAGVSVVLAAQDVAQFTDENERSTVLGNCATFVTLAGASPKTTEYVRNRLGTHSMPVLQTGAQVQRGTSPSVSRSLQTGPVLGDREIAQPPFGPRSAIVHINAVDQRITTRPVLVDLGL